MEKDMLLRDKKGVSLMIGYVLLIVIAVSLGALVFGYLKYYVSGPQAECPDNLALSIEQASCGGGIVMVQLKNRGLWNLDGAYIRIGEPGREFKLQLNAPPDTVRFADYYDTEGLPPGEIWPRVGGPRSYDYTGIGPHILEVEPALFIDDEWVLCNEAIIRPEIECGNGVNTAPIVTIRSPESTTYSPGENILFDYSIIKEDTCKFRLFDMTDDVQIDARQGLRWCELNQERTLESGNQYNFSAYGENSLGEYDIEEVIFDVAEEPINYPDITLELPLTYPPRFYDNCGAVPYKYFVNNVGDNSPVECWFELWDDLGNQIGDTQMLYDSDCQANNEIKEGTFHFGLEGGVGEGIFKARGRDIVGYEITKEVAFRIEDTDCKIPKGQGGNGMYQL